MAEFSGRLLAVDKVGSTLRLLNLATQCAERILKMPCAPHDLVLSKDGTEAFISVYGPGVYRSNDNPGREIVVVNVDSFQISRILTISPYDSPHGLAFDRRGLLWVTSDPHSRIIALDPNDGSIISSVDTGNDGTHWVLANDRSGLLYVSNKGHKVISVVDPSARSLVAQIPVPNGTEGIAFSPDGSFLFAADHRKLEILIIDCHRQRVDGRIVIKMEGWHDPDSSHHMRVAVSQDGLTLAVAAYHFNRVFLIDLTNPDKQVELATGRGPMALAFFPQQPSLLISNHDEGTLSIVDLKEKRITNTFNCGGGIESAVFLP